LRIAELRAAISLAEEEAALHQALLDLVRSDWFTAMLGELYDDPKLVTKVARDPFGYCQEKKVALPEGLTLSAVEVSKEPSTRLTAYLRYADWNVQAIWDHKGGFYARPRRPRRPRSAVSTVAP
jgi:hypothetical protein